MRGEDLSSRQLRDDLMTMLIAGHETTAAVLTWTLFELSRGDPRMLEDIQDEIDSVLGDKVGWSHSNASPPCWPHFLIRTSHARSPGQTTTTSSP